MMQHPELLQELASRPNGRTAIKRLVEMSKLWTMVERHGGHEINPPTQMYQAQASLTHDGAADFLLRRGLTSPSGELLFGVALATASISDSFLESGLATGALTVAAVGGAATAWLGNFVHENSMAVKLAARHAQKMIEAHKELVAAGLDDRYLRDGGFEQLKEAVESDISLAETLSVEPKSFAESAPILTR